MESKQSAGQLKGNSCDFSIKGEKTGQQAGKTADRQGDAAGSGAEGAKKEEAGAPEKAVKQPLTLKKVLLTALILILGVAFTVVFTAYRHVSQLLNLVPAVAGAGIFEDEGKKELLRVGYDGNTQNKDFRQPEKTEDYSGRSGLDLISEASSADENNNPGETGAGDASPAREQAAAAAAAQISGILEKYYKRPVVKKLFADMEKSANISQEDVKKDPMAALTAIKGSPAAMKVLKSYMKDPEFIQTLAQLAQDKELMTYMSKTAAAAGAGGAFEQFAGYQGGVPSQDDAVQNDDKGRTAGGEEQEEGEEDGSLSLDLSAISDPDAGRTVTKPEESIHTKKLPQP